MCIVRPFGKGWQKAAPRVSWTPPHHHLPQWMLTCVLLPQLTITLSVTVILISGSPSRKLWKLQTVLRTYKILTYPTGLHDLSVPLFPREV